MGIQDQFADSAKVFIWILVEGIQAFVLAFMWIVAAGDSEKIGEYATSQIVIYYLFVFLSWFIVGGFSHMMIANSIREGKLSNQLLKPVKPFALDFFEEQGWKTVGFLFAIPIMLILAIIFSSYINLEIAMSDVLRLIPTILIAMIIFALIDVIMGLSAFWLDSVDSVRFAFSSINSIIGGYMIPFMLLPEW